MDTEKPTRKNRIPEQEEEEEEEEEDCNNNGRESLCHHIIKGSG
jgi:hypothetical protein